MNYSPLYYLINGVSFDRTNAAASALSIPASADQGSVLLRLVNAGLRMHVPSVVGSKMMLLAEDGNPLPVSPRLQSEVLLTPGKTYDVAIQPAVVAPPTTPPTYAPATYAVFDRSLSLSTSNERDGGMQVYLNVAGGTSSGTPGSAASATALTANDKKYYCVAGSTLAVTDPSKGVLGGATGANGAVLGTVALGASDKLAFHSNGTFSYSSPADATSCGGNFQFLVNGTQAHTATIAQCDANAHSATGCTFEAAPVAAPIQFTSNVATRFAAPPPGVLAGVSSNTSGLVLTAVGSGLQADGSFVAAGPGTTAACAGLSPAAPVGATCVSFDYQAKNAQGRRSNHAQASVIFLAPSNLNVNVYDAPSLQPGHTAKKVTDYRWIIEEDKTFWIDPKCQVNSATPSR